jgi:hypothetical protein
MFNKYDYTNMKIEWIAIYKHSQIYTFLFSVGHLIEQNFCQ